jgi:4-carboxymuconolactone decarboxylase
MNDDERLKAGLQAFKQCYGDVYPPPETVDPDSFMGMTIRGLFNDVWDRPKLGFRERRLVVLGILAGIGAAPLNLEVHAKSALLNGEIEPDELREFAIMAVYYCGYGRASTLPQLVEKWIVETAAGRAGEAQPAI